uniref:Peptidase A2 domain-containing protein n=1 Tax=Myripristis murdjan TaxID=586833 RepID=A0A668B003_9TELE
MSEPENNPPQPVEFAPNQDAPPVSTINGATPRPVFMPETFTGAGREWSDWAEQFEMAADVNNWDESLRLKFMGLLLAGRAREVYSGLSAAAKTNYTLLKDAMGRSVGTPGKLEGACTEGPMPAPLPAVSTRALEKAEGGSGYLAAKIGGSSCHVLVDTGASHSIIPKQVWLSITKGGSDLQEYIGDARAANGGAMQILGGWQTVCQFDSLALVADFLVSDIPSEEILLGFDFLSRYEAVVDLGEKTCQIMGKTLPLGMKVGTLFTDIEVDEVGECIKEGDD